MTSMLDARSADSPMSLGQLRHALDAARGGYVVSDTGASTEMDERLIDVAVSTPGSRKRAAALEAARGLYRAERHSSV